MIDIQPNELLHPRIQKSCEQIFNDGHYLEAAGKAMKQVELALKERSGIHKRNIFGVTLISHVFGKGKGIKLRLPFGEEMQEETELYFRSVFKYYRNYTAHEEGKIDRSMSFRVLVIASELLDLIGASSISFAEIDGIRGLVKAGVFRDEDNVLNLLHFLDGYAFNILDGDGYFEDLAEKGYGEKEVQAVIETGLIEYSVNECLLPEEVRYLEGSDYVEIASFALTPLGKEVLDNGKAKVAASE